MIIKNLFFTSLFVLFTYAQNFKVASYNVENLFDLKYDGTEYKEYIPNTLSKWNQSTYTIKLQNISQVINDLNADIVALQEIESKKALQDLLLLTPQYSYSSFVKNKQNAIGTAIISKYRLTKPTQIPINSNRPYTRPIQKITVHINDKQIILFNNHWRSKRAGESQRIEYALTLQNYLKQLDKKTEYILLGDFNSNYNEFETFKKDKKLNDTYNVTGINQVLNTTLDKKYITKKSILSFNQKVHYNLWLDKSYHQRFSSIFKGNKNTPDNILLSPALFDENAIDYINNSFDIFKPNYLYQNNTINRWRTQGKNRVHQGSGYSDHLPIYAIFSTKKRFQNEINKENINPQISTLYQTDTLEKSLKIYNAVVIYKHKNGAIIKQENDRAIYIYKNIKNLELGNSYDLEISQIKSYEGLKEITKIQHTRIKEKSLEYKNLYLNATKMNILENKYQNEIITHLNGTYKNGYLHYTYNHQTQKIKLYAKNKALLPNNGQNITIMSAHLGFYKSKPQLVIYKESDFSVN